MQIALATLASAEYQQENCDNNRVSEINMGLLRFYQLTKLLTWLNCGLAQNTNVIWLRIKL